jgi:hypothetical protein
LPSELSNKGVSNKGDIPNYQGAKKGDIPDYPGAKKGDIPDYPIRDIRNVPFFLLSPFSQPIPVIDLFAGPGVLERPFVGIPFNVERLSVER